jgi:protein AATF/BFR2
MPPLLPRSVDPRYHFVTRLVGFCAPVEAAPPPFAAQLFSNLFGAGGGAL